MADDAATIERLRAELRRVHELHATEVGILRQDVAKLTTERSEARDRQTATADVLRVIAESPSDLQSVLDGIAASAARLCEASDAAIGREEASELELRAADQMPEELLASV